jgi:putative ABC transport system substrate-binding protein
VKRRAFIRLLGALVSLVMWRVARAQRAGTKYRIGFLGGADPVGYTAQMEALRLGLRDHGYVEGENVTIEYRWAEGKYERLASLAAELVSLKVDVIITQGTPAALAAKRATTTIPIVMTIVGNPVETGIVASLARPGGNITGSSFFVAELNAKRLELVKTLSPGLARVGVLINPDNPAVVEVLRALEEAARVMNVTLQQVKVRDIDELDKAFELARSQVEGLTVWDEGLFIANARRIAELATRSGLPSVGFGQYCEVGGLAAYGVHFPDIWRRSMALVDKILKGAKPADLPVEQATRFYLAINMKTAKVLGLAVPPMLLARADEVIE